MARIKSDWERLCDWGALLIVVLFVAVVVLDTMLTSTVEATGPTIAGLERQVWELERQLDMYRNANGLIVVRDDGACAEQWWLLGTDLDCGTSWGRFRVPVGGTNLERIPGTEPMEPGTITVEYGTKVGK